MKKLVIFIAVVILFTGCSMQNDVSNISSEDIASIVSTPVSSVPISSNSETIVIPEKYQWLYDKLVQQIDENEKRVDNGDFLPPLAPITIIALADLNHDDVPEIFVGVWYMTGMMNDIYYDMYTANGEKQLEHRFVVMPSENAELFNNTQYTSPDGTKYCQAIFCDGAILSNYSIVITKIFYGEKGWELVGENYGYGEKPIEIGMDLIKNPPDKAEKLDTIIKEVYDEKDVQLFFKEHILE